MRGYARQSQTPPKMMLRRAAGELEAVALGGVGRPIPAVPGEIRGRLGGDLAYTTVVTILSRLHAKGMLGSRKARAGLPVSAGRRPAGAGRMPHGPGAGR